MWISVTSVKQIHNISGQLFHGHLYHFVVVVVVWMNTGRKLLISSIPDSIQPQTLYFSHVAIVVYYRGCIYASAYL